jgi:CBS-domain-containing membrane protein
LRALLCQWPGPRLGLAPWLVPVPAEGGHHHIPVIDADLRLVGIVIQTDLVRAPYSLAPSLPDAS